MNGELLGRIGSPADVKALDPAELPQLCADIRSTLVAYGKAHGGHIGSNLGVVELTVALHRVFDSPRDRIVFDVSHQSYVHKMLTGRAQAYLDPDRYDEVTGFTNPEESEHDQFVLGHTGTSISLACGLAKTRDMMGGLNGGSGIGNVIAVIGDGSLSSAIAFEGLNNAAEQGGNLIVIVNDNEMSIAEDFGGMYGPLARLRESGGTAEPNLFHAFGLDYRYVEDGNNVAALVETLDRSRTSTIRSSCMCTRSRDWGWTPRTRRPGSSRDAARRTTGRIRCPPPTACPGHASITARWRCRRWRSGSPRSRAWSSSPPPPQGRTASPGRSASVPARTTWTPASRRSMRSPSPPASPRPAGVRCWPRRPRSSQRTYDSCNRSWP